MKNISVEMLPAIAYLAQEHLIIIGPPGVGKSTLARSFLHHLGGGLILSLDPSTPPSRIIGFPNPASLLEGVYVLRTEGTVLDPDVDVVVLDEIFRASEPAWDALLAVLERGKPSIIATSNWVASEDRVEALKDRFALWAWITCDDTIIDEAPRVAHDALRRLSASRKGDIAAQLSAIFPFEGWPSAERLRRARRESCPGPRAVRAIQEAVRDLARFVSAEAGFTLNRRRLAQWARLLWGAGLLMTEEEDFQELPVPARAVLRWAWPAATLEEAERWSALVDEWAVPGAGILRRAFVELGGVLAEAQEARGEDRNEKILNAAQRIVELQHELLHAAGERVANIFYEKALSILHHLKNNQHYRLPDWNEILEITQR